MSDLVWHVISSLYNKAGIPEGLFWGESPPPKLATPLKILSSFCADNDLQQSAPLNVLDSPQKYRKPPGSPELGHC